MHQRWDVFVMKSEARSQVSKGVKDFEYLVGMPISTLTAEKVAELMQQRETKAPP